MMGIPVGDKMEEESGQLTVDDASSAYCVNLKNGQLKPGYKQTEVGVIPEEWDVIPMGSLGVFSKGHGIRKDEAASGVIPCIRYGEIYTFHNDHIRSFNSLELFPMTFYINQIDRLIL